MTGLKTGSTSLAKYCVSATAEKDGIRLIAVVMGAPDYKARFSDAQQLLNYGYSNCRLYEDTDPPALTSVPVKGGVKDQVQLAYSGVFSYLSLSGEDLSGIQREVKLAQDLQAPVETGQKAGVLEYTLNGRVIGSIDIVSKEAIERAGYLDELKKLAVGWLC